VDDDACALESPKFQSNVRVLPSGSALPRPSNATVNGVPPEVGFAVIDATGARFVEPV
jgi:hypothetical protein